VDYHDEEQSNSTNQGNAHACLPAYVRDGAESTVEACAGKLDGETAENGSSAATVLNWDGLALASTS
jgi:hypothetical protein